MKVRIVNDGGPGHTTRLTDAETGQPIEYATGVEINLVVDVASVPRAHITTIFPCFDVVAEAEFHTVCPCCGREMPPKLRLVET